MSAAAVYAETVPKRTLLFAGVALLAVPAALLFADRAGPAGISASVVGCGVLAMVVGWPVGRRYAHVLAIAGGTASLAVTAYTLVTNTTFEPTGAFPRPIELIGLYLLIAAVARWTEPIRVAVVSGGVAWLACVVWILRLTTETEPLIILSNVTASAVFPTAAAFAGGLPRYLAQRRAQLVAATRREQRLELAHDLHDFVAHDLTGIVAQAQAARFAQGNDAKHLREALEQIETVGVAALDTMDGFVHVLHTDDPAPRSPRGIPDLPALVERFRAEREPSAVADLKLDNLCMRLPRQLQATAYRVVVEGLTNVRRHAAPGCAVIVAVESADDGTVTVTVSNDFGAASLHSFGRYAGGTGLDALRDRVSAVGGRLEAGPDGAGFWHLRATLPRTDVKDGSP